MKPPGNPTQNPQRTGALILVAAAAAIVMDLANETELYQERLAQANVEMKRNLDLLLQNDPEAIVIFAGDHGPYLTKNCYYLVGSYTSAQIDRLDIQDRFGVFLAIRWPTESYKAYDQFTVLQDLFPVVLSYLYDDAALLDIRVESVTQFQYSTSWAYVDHGIIKGGLDDGEPLFLGD